MSARRERELRAADGTVLYLRETLPEARPASAPRGGILFMHGLGEHCARFDDLATFFAEQGWIVRAYDHRGHGRSGGARGDTPSAQALVDDGERVIADFAREIGSAPLLLGHSMGGLFAARVAVAGRVALRGLILSSPLLALTLSGIEKALLAVLSCIAPGLGVPNGVDSRVLSHDARIGQAYDRDPLVHNKISARLLRSLLTAIAATHADVTDLHIPVLLLVAGDDKLVDANGSKRFYAALPPAQAQMVWYEGFYHEIFFELESARVFADLQTWLNQHGWGHPVA